MLRILFSVLSFLMISPCFAGELEDALNTNSKVFLYLYTKECGYCVKFNPIYDIISKKFANDCKFLKVNARTSYGQSLMRIYNGVFVPYLLLFDTKNKQMARLNPDCYLDTACITNAIDVWVHK